METLSEEVQRRFWEKIRKGDVCWEWVRYRNACGYGVMAISGRTTLAHRISWMIHFGAIPEGRNVLHRCDNPACVRPDHLFIGTQVANMKDMVRKGRANRASGQRHHMARTTGAQAQEIVNRFTQGERAEDLAHEFGINFSTVYRMARGNHWKELTRDEDAVERRHRLNTTKTPEWSRNVGLAQMRLTPTQVAEIRQRLAGGERGYALAKEFGVSKQTISNVKNYRCGYAAT